MSVSAVIPAHNEAATVGQTVQALRQLEEIDEVIVVDDGSTDKTAEIARRAGATTFSLVKNRGKGQALQVGCAAAEGDILLLIDADVGESAFQARKLLIPVLTGQADVTVAVLPSFSGKAGLGLVIGLARWAIRRSGGQVVQAPVSGQRALRRDVWRRLGLFAGGYGAEVAMSMGVYQFGYRLVEVPVEMTHAATGRNWRGFCHRGKQFLHILLAIIRHLRWVV